MMSKSLTFYLLNHYQGVIILVCVCVCDMYLYIFVIQLYYGYKLVTLMSQILIFLFTRV